MLGAVGGVNAPAGMPDAGVAGASPGSLAPTVAGIRSIRIDIPRTGQAFLFTKVLNVNDEPLLVKISAMKLTWFQGWRAALQLVAFLGGLLIVWRQWRRANPNTLWLTVGLALVIISVTSLLIAGRLLHVALIAALPVLLVLALVWWARRFWLRRKAAAANR